MTTANTFAGCFWQATGQGSSLTRHVLYRMSGYSRVSYIGRSDRKMAAQFASMQLHIGYLRSLEDSDRVRAACVNYLQTWLPELYPERLDLVEKAAQLAESLGGRLQVPPPLSWKYAWIEKGLWSRPREASADPAATVEVDPDPILGQALARFDNGSLVPSGLDRDR